MLQRLLLIALAAHASGCISAIAGAACAATNGDNCGEVVSTAVQADVAIAGAILQSSRVEDESPSTSTASWEASGSRAEYADRLRLVDMGPRERGTWLRAEIGDASGGTRLAEDWSLLVSTRTPDVCVVDRARTTFAVGFFLKALRPGQCKVMVSADGGRLHRLWQRDVHPRSQLD